MTITREQVVEQLLVLRRDFPDKTNPVREMGTGSGCVYSNEAGDHCIAGQTYLNLGLTLPQIESSDNYGIVASDYFFLNQGVSQGAATLLRNAQILADGQDGGNGKITPIISKPLPWGIVIDTLKGRGLL
jgi:hypothetical protein